MATIVRYKAIVSSSEAAVSYWRDPRTGREWFTVYERAGDDWRMLGLVEPDELRWQLGGPELRRALVSAP